MQASSGDGGAEEVDSSVVKMDALGPMVLNTDGSISRISNWTDFTEAEKESAVRLITKRNKKRREELMRERPELLDQTNQRTVESDAPLPTLPSADASKEN